MNYEETKSEIRQLIPDQKKGRISANDVYQSFEKTIDAVDAEAKKQIQDFDTYAKMIVTDGVAGVIYRVSNDPDPLNNGYYHWTGSAYVKDASLANGVIEDGDVEPVSGGTVFDYVQDGYIEYDSSLVSSQELSSVKSINKISLFGLESKIFRLVKIQNNETYPYQIGILDEDDDTIYTLIFGGNIPTKRFNLLTGSIEITIDWNKVVEFAKGVNGVLYLTKKCYQLEKVNLTTSQTIEGVKTFSSSPLVPTPTDNFQASTKEYTDEKTADVEVLVTNNGNVEVEGFVTPDDAYGRASEVLVNQYSKVEESEGVFHFERTASTVKGYIRFLEIFDAALDNTIDAWVEFDYKCIGDGVKINALMLPYTEGASGVAILEETSVWKRLKYQVNFVSGWVNGTNTFADYFIPYTTAHTDLWIKNIRIWQNETAFELADNERIFNHEKRITDLEEIEIPEKLSVLESLSLPLYGKSLAVLGDSIMMLMRTNAIGSQNITWLGDDANTYDFADLTNTGGILTVTANPSITVDVSNTAQADIDIQNWDALKSKLGLSELINCGSGGGTIKESSVVTDKPYYGGIDSKTTCIPNAARWLKRLVDEEGRATPDVIMIWAGTNDSGGTIADNFDTIIGLDWSVISANDATGHSYRQTFYGGLRFTLEFLYREYQNATIFVFAPVQADEDYYTTRTYENESAVRDAIKLMSDRFACVFVDSLNEIGIVDKFEFQDGSGYFLGDGFHPNSAGKILFKNYAASKINNNYFNKTD